MAYMYSVCHACQVVAMNGDEVPQVPQVETEAEAADHEACSIAEQ